ncbi:MAG: extracellular solute-binding protein [Actinobacteria bacterium]|nr:extracellular solute-binding protein [Actinomycetota bacterium]
MKKFWVFLLITVFSVSMLALGVGCKTGGTTAEETAAETQAQETTAAAETTVAAEEEPIVITVMDWQSGSAFDPALEEINALYQEQNPNVTIDRTGVNLTEYAEVIKTAIQSDTLPDLFGLYQGTQEREVEKTGILFEWDDAINADPEWKANLGKTYGMGGTLSADGKTIAIPYDIFYIATFGYRNVLESMGSSEEEVRGLKSYRELADLAQRFKSEGHPYWYLSVGFAGPYLLRETFYSWVYSVSKDFNYVYEAEFGKISWTEEPFILAAQAVRDTYDMVREDAQALDPQVDNYALILNQETWGSWYEGPWSTGILRDNPAAIENVFAFFKPPIAPDALENVWAVDAAQVLSIEKDNPKLDEILKYMKFLATPEVSSIFIKYLIHPAGKFPDNWKEIAQYPIYAEMVEMYETGNVGPWICYTPEVEQALLDNLALIFTGDLTPEEGMAKVDEATKAYWASQ